jgi:hypothetical protein
MKEMEEIYSMTLKKNYEELVKAVNNGKEFFIPEDKVEEELKPLDQKLFESLRKKFKI